MSNPSNPPSTGAKPPGAGDGQPAPQHRPPETAIFTKTFDFLSWLLPHTNHFPRVHRHSLTRRLLDAALDFREFLEEANLRRGAARQERLVRADEELAKIRLYLRLASKFGWQTPSQYQHAFQMLVEIGRLLGGWQKVRA